MSDINNGIRRLDENRYDIYIRDNKRRLYRRVPDFKRPGVYMTHQLDWFKGRIITERDSQRQKCYDAESECRKTIPTQRTYGTTREVATYMRNILESDWFQRRFPHFFMLRIAYEPGSRNAHARPTEETTTSLGKEAVRGWIGFSSWARGDFNDDNRFGGEMIMLHELAHAILPETCWHDRRWARVFVDLVTHYMGKPQGTMLKAYMKKHRVKMTVPKKVSAEQRAAAAARLSVARRSLPIAAGKAS